MRLAAIDIGSNAARLLINDVYPGPHNEPVFIKVALVRIPLRLGFDTFVNGEISNLKTDKLIKTLKVYKLLLDIYDVKHYKACATSAMRDAINSERILHTIKNETGLKLDIITGTEEASLIFESHIAETLPDDESYLYIDVGGGSTEITFFSDSKLIFKKSFNIGTIRLLKNQVNESLWDELKEFILQNTRGFHNVTAIGSGGNINKIFSISKKKEAKPLSIEILRDYYKEFSSMTVADRITTYKFREDRADVIVPALLIFISIMRWADAENIYVPKIGLVDGLMHVLHDSLKQELSTLPE